MHCLRARRALAAYSSGELSAKDRAALEAHLSACASCRAQHDLLARSWDALGAVEDIEPSADFTRSTAAAVRAAATRSDRGPAPSALWLRMAWAFSLVLAIAIGGAVGRELVLPTTAMAASGTPESEVWLGAVFGDIPRDTLSTAYLGFSVDAGGQGP